MSTFTQDVSGHVMYLRFGQPGAHNPMRDDWFEELTQILKNAKVDPDVRCIHLSAEGKSFSSGGDLQAFNKGAFPNGALNSSLAACLEEFESFDKPIVAVVHGAAIGGGATLLLHCDFVYAEAEVTFQLPFTRVGVVPELGSTFLLALHAGQRLATELILLGKPFNATTAQQAGLVNEVLTGTDLQERAKETARALASLPPASMRHTKALLKRALRNGYADAWRAELLELERRFESDELREACAAVMEKRKPDFSRFS